jgi:hypothetical protein
MWTLSTFHLRRHRSARPNGPQDDADRQARRIKAAIRADRIQRERGKAESHIF